MKLFRLVRFRLRTLLALVTLVSALLGYYVYTANQYAREMAAIEKLHQLTGGSFWLLLRLDENVLFSGEPPAVAALLDWQGPALLRAPMKRWNAPIFYRCVQLDLQTDVFDDTSIPTIALLQHLKKLSLQTTAITPAGAERLRNLLPHTELEYARVDPP